MREHQLASQKIKMLPNPNPLSRILNTLLLHALQDGARAIRLKSGSKEVTVEFFIGESWREQLKIPAYVFAPLTAHIEAMQTAPGAIQLRFVESDFGLGIEFLLTLQKTSTENGECLEMSLTRFDFEGNFDQQAR